MSFIMRIIRYIAGTIELGLWNVKDTSCHIVAFSDAYWAGKSEDRKSTSRACFFIENNLVYWLSKKRSCISLSTTEVEYVPAGDVRKLFG